MKKTNAFSLLEAILSIAIIGLIASSFSLVYITISLHNKKKINEYRFHEIRIAIQSYLIRNGKLPCAASKNNGESTQNTYIGYVPYKTLGIAKKHTLDSNNKPFKYIVNKNFTETNIPLYAPLSIPPQSNEKSFLRLYNYVDGRLFYDHKENHIVLKDKNNQSILDENDFFYVRPPMRNIKTPQELKIWLTTNSELEEYKVYNQISWLLISEGSTESEESKINRDQTYFFYTSSKDGSFTDQVFFQTRFDLAAQIGFYCTAEPIKE